MTRDEAIEWLLRRADQYLAWEERINLTEAKAALAEPIVTPQGRCQHQAADACLDCGGSGYTTEAEHNPRCDGSCAVGCPVPVQACCRECGGVGKTLRLDCAEPAVLCESHGGHDACAVEIARLEAATADLREMVSDEHERGYKRARDEIARALEAEARRRLDEYDQNHDDYALNTASGFEAVAEMVRHGTITQWLPRGGK